MEVFTGTRPGRPTVLLFLSAGALVVTLSAAWLQVRQRGGLAAETTVSDTPLRVCPPRGWKATREPGTFVLPLDRKTARGAETTIERRLSVRYQRLGGYRPPEYLLQGLIAPGTPVEAARIGGYPGVQVLGSEQVRLGRHLFTKHAIRRLACTPRGDLVTVEYVPLTELTYGDLDLLDEVCASIRVADAGFGAAAADLLRAAGLELDAPREWSAIGADGEKVEGLYLGGASTTGPGWALGVFRTWLAGGRSPEALLTDFALTFWELSAEQVRTQRAARADGAVVYRLRHPAAETEYQFVAGVSLVVQGPAQAALVYEYCGPAGLAASTAAVDLVTARLRFREDSALPLESAGQAGEEIAGKLQRRGGIPAAWGRMSQRHYYLASGAFGSQAVIVEHGAVDGSSEHGYEGGARHFFENRQRSSEWSVDARAQAYQYTLEAYRGGADSPVPFAVAERRAAAGSAVTRVVTTQRRRATDSFEVGPAFVCPPIESIAEWWAATGDAPAYLIECSTLTGLNTHMRLMRPLPPDPDGLARVLVQQDYDPRGMVLGVSADTQPVYQIEPGVIVRKVTRGELERAFPGLP